MKMQKYTPEFIAYVRKYPFAVIEDFKNGVKNEIVFESKPDALAYIERGKARSVRTKYALIENRLNPEYI